MSLLGTPDHPTTGRVEVAGREEILRVLLKAGIVAVLGTFALLVAFEGGRIVLWPYVAMLASHLSAWFLLRAGHLRFAVVLHASAYIATILLVLFLYGGLRSPAGFVLSPIVLLVGLTWSGRAAIVTAAICSLGMLGLIVQGAVRNRLERGELTYWVVATAVLALTSVVLALALRSIGRAQAQALRAERERYALQARLHRSERLETVARLAAGVAHDFNNLLNVIVGQAGMLARHPEEKTAARAKQIEGAAWRAADLTNKLLAVGRKQDLASRELELNAVVRALEPLLRQSLEGDDRLTFDLAEGPLRLRADATGLEQILLNLVRNAGDATRAGGEIRVGTRRAEAGELSRLPGWSPREGSALRLEVADSGVGMSAEVQAHLFEPFFTTKEAGQGTGLGLASVYGIVQQCGGVITVESAVGRGTALGIFFPEAPPADPVRAEAG